MGGNLEATDPISRFSYSGQYSDFVQRKSARHKLLRPRYLFETSFEQSVICCLNIHKMVINVNKMKEYALIGAVMIIGVLAGTVYVHAVGSQQYLTLIEGAPKTAGERIALENQAIELALADPRIQPLANVSGVKIFSVFTMHFQIIFDNNVTQSGKDTVDWDQKYRATVWIRYTDNSGYSVDVNITDKLVGEPVHVVWKGNDVYLK